MRQILVGGDNQDAYLICDALEQHLRIPGLLVLFCATHQEILTNLGRGDTALVFLNFEKAALTNYEIAHRVIESSGSRQVGVMLPEVDAMGDARRALGKNVVVFGFPINAAEVLAKAKEIMERTPPPAKSAAAGGAQPAENDTRRTPAAGAAEAAPGDTNGTASNGDAAAKQRSRRVRHRSWRAVREDAAARYLPAPATTSANRPPEDEDVVIYRSGGPETPKPSRRPPKRLLAILAVLAALAMCAYLARGVFGEGDDAAEETITCLCTGCGNVADRAYSNVQGSTCRKCKAPMGVAFHCLDCKRGFGHIFEQPLTSKKQLKDVTECPFCGSTKIKLGPPPAGGKDDE